MSAGLLAGAESWCGIMAIEGIWRGNLLVFSERKMPLVTPVVIFGSQNLK